MSQSGERDSRASAEALLKKAQKLEQQLRTTLQAKGFSDGNAYSILTTLRSTYQEILLTDHAFAVEHDVEQALWRGIYRRIEDFRGRIRKYSQAAAAGNSAAAPLPAGPAKPGPKPGQAKEALQKALSGFRGFLGDATGFYHELVFKLRALYGLPQDFSPAVPEDVAARVPPEKLRLCQASCHRCLIYLGDLARYKELHSDGKVKDWAIVANYYLQAAALWPASGNPHNQLAVLATYVDDELLAVYRYYRSLAVEVAFLTARDNLLMLFEKNRVKYNQLAAPKKAPTKPAPMTAPADSETLSKTRLSFRTRFVRLNGIIFTKTSVETFSDVYSATMSDLDTLLEVDDVALEADLGAERRSGIGPGSGGAAGFLQVMTISIFTAHNLSWLPEGHKPSYSEIIQSSTLAQHAYTALFELGGRLAHRCGLADNPAVSPLLPSILVLLEWLTCSPKAAVGDGEVGERQARARSFFWREVSGLTNDVIRPAEDDVIVPKLPGALWEDYELRGFEPLAGVQKVLDFSRPAPALDFGKSHQTAERARRVLAAGKGLASHLVEARVEGLRFSEELGLFQYSREVSERRPEDLKVLERGEVPGALEKRTGSHGLGGGLAGLGGGLAVEETGVEQGLLEGAAGFDSGRFGNDVDFGPGLSGLPPVLDGSVVAPEADMGGGLAADEAGFGQGLSEKMEDAKTEDDDDLMSSSKEELEAAKRQLFQRAQQAGKLKGPARDELAVEAERVFRAQLAAKKGVEDLVKQTEKRLDEDEEEIVFQPTRRISAQASPLTGSPMQSQSPRRDNNHQGPVRTNQPSAALLHNLDPAPKQGLPSPSDPVVGSSAFSFNQWMPSGAKRVDGAKSAEPSAFPSLQAKAKSDIEAVTNHLLNETSQGISALDPDLRARGFEQLQQLYDLQRQLQGQPAASTSGGFPGQQSYPPGSKEALQPAFSAQQQYYHMLVQQQQGLANHGLPAQQQNGPGYQQWGASPYTWTGPLQSSSLFEGSGFSAAQQSGSFGFGLNPASNQVTAQGPTLQQSRVTIPLPQPLEQGLSAPSLFAAPPVDTHSKITPAPWPNSLFGEKATNKEFALPGGGLTAARPPPPGFRQPAHAPGAIRPPPGFGQPVIQRSKSPYSANGTVEPASKPVDAPPLDDYKWLDGYTHAPGASSAEHVKSEYGMGEASIWGRSSSPAAEWGVKKLPEQETVTGQTYGASAYKTKNPFVS